MQQQPTAGGGAARPFEPHRLFFALMPDEETRDRLHREALQLKALHGPRGRWTHPQRYHLTLQFLGDFDGLPTQAVAQARTAAAAVRIAPFTLVLDRAGSFPNRSIPWWLGPAADQPALAGLRNALEAALVSTGLHCPDGPGFRPHVTVLRDAGTVLLESAIDPIAWRVEAFTLVHSLPGRGSAYAPMGTWPLRA